jgi:hypothetical protein
MDIVKVGVCGSPLYENKTRIKEAIFKLKKTFGQTLVIVSGGRKDGADKHIKKYALEFGCKYKEFNPAHTKRNLYSILHENAYGKPYSPRNFFIRNSMMIKYVDYMLVFVEKGKGNPDIAHIIDETRKKDKKLIMFD